MLFVYNHRWTAVAANPFVVWPLVHHTTFSEAVEHLDELDGLIAEGGGVVDQGGVLEALLYFHGGEKRLPLYAAWHVENM